MVVGGGCQHWILIGIILIIHKGKLFLSGKRFTDGGLCMSSGISDPNKRSIIIFCCSLGEPFSLTKKCHSAEAGDLSGELLPLGKDERLLMSLQVVLHTSQLLRSVSDD